MGRLLACCTNVTQRLEHTAALIFRNIFHCQESVQSVKASDWLTVLILPINAGRIKSSMTQIFGKQLVQLMNERIILGLRGAENPAELTRPFHGLE